MGTIKYRIIMKKTIILSILISMLFNSCDSTNQKETTSVEVIMDSSLEISNKELYSKAEMEMQINNLSTKLSNLEISDSLNEILLNIDYFSFVGKPVSSLTGLLLKPNKYYYSSEPWGYISSVNFIFENQIYLEIILYSPFKHIKSFSEDNEWEIDSVKKERINELRIKDREGNYLLMINENTTDE